MKCYFDNAATTYTKPKGMYEYLSNFMCCNGANVGRGMYDLSINSRAVVNNARTNILNLMTAPETKRVVFLPSATIALNAIIFGVGLTSGDIVYISHFEHNAILRPLFKLQKEKGILIKYLPMVGDSLEFDLQNISAAIMNDKPKLVVVSHVSNVLGLVAPINEISHIVKAVNAIMVVDGAQACGMQDCDLNFIDYYVFAGHKTLLGPMGIGGFICNNSCDLSPFIYGGTGIDSSNQDMPSSLPERFEAGTLNLMSIVGLNFSVKWLIEHRQEAIEKENHNVELLYRILIKYDYLKLISPYPNNSGIISCKVNGYTSDEFGMILSNFGVAVRTGLHCAPQTHKYIGSFPEGLVRFSVSPFTEKEDFVELEKALDKISLEI